MQNTTIFEPVILTGFYTSIKIIIILLMNTVTTKALQYKSIIACYNNNKQALL